MSAGCYAFVTAYSANRSDTRLTLKIECLTCGIEWGWSDDSKGASAELEAMAAAHRREARK